MRKSKYGNKPVEVDGIRFASKKEAKRYGELLLLQRGGVIRGLKLQPRYALTANEHKICTYVGDFEYLEGERTVVEDAKGMQTPEFKLKFKLAIACFPYIDWRLV